MLKKTDNLIFDSKYSSGTVACFQESYIRRSHVKELATDVIGI